MRTKLGECLVQAGLITEDDLRAALGEHKRTGERLGVVLARMSLATEEQIAQALAFQLGFPYVSLVENPPNPSAVFLIPKDVALTCGCVAVSFDKRLLTVAMADPLVFSLVQDLESRTGYRIRQVVATRGDIVDAIHAGYPDTTLVRPAPADKELSSTARDVAQSLASEHRRDTALTRASDQEVFDLVDLVVQSAITSKASDIHVEPMETGVRIRHRLDGVLKAVMDVPEHAHEGLIARLKKMAGMDIAENRLPQDGRIRVRAKDGSNVDFRVSTLRTLFGEKVTMRMVDHRKVVPALEDIGMSAAALDTMRQFLRHQRGMILVVGPRGSGKTTTLNSALLSVKSENRNVVTIEDPVEYRIPGVNQTQIDEKIALSFASTLRSILRQDPDVVLLGDIRDPETAEIAMHAAQTGQLLLSALYTEDAPSCVTRLTDIGAEPFVVASALLGVVAQRLVRRLCVHCRAPYTPTENALRSLGISGANHAATGFCGAVGCDQCNHTGYRGRIGIYEVMRVTDALRRLITARANEDQIREQAIADGMITLGEDGLAKVKSGITTAEELLRVVTTAREKRALCPGCGSVVGVDFKACPACGKGLGGACPHCGRAIQPGWNFCPYCTRSTEGGKAVERPRKVSSSEVRPGA